MTESLLLALADAGVEFVVVGGMAAVAQGVPVVTHDVNIVHRRTPENVGRLVALLEQHDTIVRGQFGRRIKPRQEHLEGTGTCLTSTALGQLDILGALRDGRDYAALIPDCITLEVAGRLVQILGLQALVEIKRASPDPKDVAHLPLFEAALARIGSMGSERSD